MNSSNIITLILVFLTFNSCSLQKKSINYTDNCVDNLTYKQVIDTLIFDRYYSKPSVSTPIRPGINTSFPVYPLEYYVPILEEKTKIYAKWDHITCYISDIQSDSLFNDFIRKCANFVHYKNLILPKPIRTTDPPFIIEEDK